MKYNSFETLFNHFNTINALIIGDVMIDAYIWGKVERISPEAPVPVVRVTKRDYRLGGAANVALNVQALGANPIICSIIGNDEEASRLEKQLHTVGISAEGLIRSDERPTTVKTRVISANHHIVRIDEESTSDITVKEKAFLLKKIELLLPKCDVVIFEDYDKGCIDAEVIQKTVALAKTHNIPTVVDPKKRNFLDYKNTTLFKPNLKELKEGLKLEFDATNSKELIAAVQQLKQTISCDVALITLSEHGVMISDNHSNHHIPAHVREIADVSGAGDTVISIAALAMALQLPSKLVAELSNLGGGLVCEHVGVVTINKQQLLKEAEKGISL